MDGLGDLWAAYEGTFGLAMVNAMFALSCYATLAAGMLSFAAVIFGAAGGFLGVQLVLHTALPLGAVMLASGLAGLAVALALGAVLVRLDGKWLALASLALVMAMREVVLRVPALTGGANGLSVPVRLPLGWLALTLFVVMIGYRGLFHSWYGIATRVQRDDPTVAAGLGVDIGRMRLVAFGVSGFTGGVAGVLLALLLQFVSPDTFYVHLAFTTIAAVVLGGAYHWLGPVVGAGVFTVLPMLFQWLLPDVQDVAEGAVLLLAMIFLPRGLVDPRVLLMHLTVAQATRSRDRSG